MAYMYIDMRLLSTWTVYLQIWAKNACKFCDLHVPLHSCFSGLCVYVHDYSSDIIQTTCTNWAIVKLVPYMYHTCTFSVPLIVYYVVCRMVCTWMRWWRWVWGHCTCWPDLQRTDRPWGNSTPSDYLYRYTCTVCTSDSPIAWPPPAINKWNGQNSTTIQ